MKKVNKTNGADEANKAKKPAIKLSDLEPKKDPKGGPISPPNRPLQGN